jgi:hypothetical protein
MEKSNLIIHMYKIYKIKEDIKYIPIKNTLNKYDIKLLINDLITNNYINNRKIKSDLSNEFTIIINIAEIEKDDFFKLNNKLIDFYKIYFLFTDDICIGISSKYIDDTIPDINILSTYIVNEILFYINKIQFEKYPDYKIIISDDIKMLNYYYYIYIENDLIDTQKNEHYNKIFDQIIFKYSYPYCTISLKSIGF